LLVFIIYNYHGNKDAIKELTKLLKINKDKTQTKVLEAEFVKEFLINLKEDDVSKHVKESILIGEKYFDSTYDQTFTIFKESL
jgi:hypothetical protein